MINKLVNMSACKSRTEPSILASLILALYIVYLLVVEWISDKNTIVIIIVLHN